MASGTKRDAQEAFGETSPNVAAAQQQQKKQKSSRRKSKHGRRDRENPKHIDGDHERQQVISGSPARPEPSAKKLTQRVSHPAALEKSDMQISNNLVKQENSTPSRRDGRTKKKSRSLRPVPTSDQTNAAQKRNDRRQQARRGSKSPGNERVEAQVAAVASQEADIPTEHSVIMPEKLSLPDDVPAPQGEGPRPDTNEELGQAKSLLREKREKSARKEQRKIETENTEPVALKERSFSENVVTPHDEVSLDDGSLNNANEDVSSQIKSSRREKRAQKEQRDNAFPNDANGQVLSQVKSSRREKKSEKQGQKTETQITKPVVSEQHKERGKSKKRKRNREPQQITTLNRSDGLESSGWAHSPATGGTFIDHDPVLTPDEKTLILATDRDILIYSTKTSLLVRKLNIVGKSAIVTYALDTGDKDFLYAGLEDGNIYKYDWTSGHRSWHFKLRNRLKSITPTSSGPDGDNFLIVHSTEADGQNLSSLSLNAKGEETGRKRMISDESLNGNVKFSADMGIAIICTTDTAFVGRFVEKPDDKGEELKWNQISVPGSMTCFDAQILPPSASAKSKKRAKFATVNIAVGLTTGEIHLYSDILNQGMGLNDNQSSNTTTRRLHWHRTAPLSVKFSLDSNYLVSGGDETVLVIWQLDTNQKQVLPHLTTPILNLTISRLGSAYALRLADNSVMVLSTADLQPFTNVNGLAMPVSSETLHQPAILHPNHSEHLLLTHSLRAVKPEGSKNYKSSTMLQTYDMGSQIQVGSQALARNLVSIVSAGPNGQLLREPDVTNLDISHDGKWLASVDQWSPNRRDLDEMYLSRGDNLERRRNHECYLRLWASASMKRGSTGMNEQWELNTRFDEAIVEGEWLSGGSRILAMVFSPTRHQLAVANSNRHVKVYSPKARMRSGLPIKDQDGNQLFTWTCDHEIPVEAVESSKTADHAALAFSEDGSVLAACWTSNISEAPRLHLMDPKLGAEATLLPDLITSDRPIICFYHQYLICLSSKLCIFDTVNAQRTFEFDLSSGHGQMQSKMAINVRNGTLAMSVDSTQYLSRLLLFDIRSGIPSVVYDKKVAARIAVLLADKANGGFVVVHRDGKISRLSAPGQRGEVIATADVVGSRAVTNGIEHIFGSGQKQIKDVAGPVRGDLVRDGPQRRTLEDVFRFGTTAQAPSVKDLFTQVAQAVVGRSE